MGVERGDGCMAPTRLPRLTRRDLLRSGGAFVAAGTAGCTSTLPPLGRRTRYGRVDPPAVGEPTYRRWMPAESALPDAVATEDLDGAGEIHLRPARIYEHFDDYGHPLALPSLFLAVVGSYVDYFGEPLERVDEIVGTDLGAVALTDLERSAIGSTLIDSGYEAVGSYDGYDLYERGDVPRMFGVADGRVVFTRNDPLRPTLEVMVDARAGRIARRHEVDDAFAELTERVGGGAAVTSMTNWLVPTTRGGYPDLGDSALSIRPTDDGVYYVGPMHFPDGPPNVDAIRERMTGWHRQRGVDLTEVDVDDRWATVEMYLRLATLRSEWEDRGRTDLPRPGLVTWGVEHDDDAGTLTIRHEAGEPMPADPLRVRPVVEDPDAVRFTGLENGQFGPGDAVVMDLSAVSAGSDHVRLYLETENVSRTVFDYDLSNLPEGTASE